MNEEWRKIPKFWQNIIIVIVLACVFFSVINLSGTALVGLLIGWFICAPITYDWAEIKGRNKIWAFCVGLFFGIPGAVMYWFYKIFFKDVKTNEDEED